MHVDRTFRLEPFAKASEFSAGGGVKHARRLISVSEVVFVFMPCQKVRARYKEGQSTYRRQLECMRMLPCTVNYSDGDALEANVELVKVARSVAPARHVPSGFRFLSFSRTVRLAS